MIKNYGATPAEWAHFDSLLGLGADMLPVVSNPDAVISPNSEMKQKGKVPSRYNKQHQVAGVAKWTAHRASPAEIEQWSREPDYGICLQTRTVRALDIDVEDQLVAAEIGFAIMEITGQLPVRFRADSGKCLFAFEMPGPFTKRIIKTAHGNIEFLANGQQFVAAGTHPKGARYEWAHGLPDAVPVLDAVTFELVWEMLDTAYSIAPQVTLGAAGGRKGVDFDVDDATLNYLNDHDIVIGGDDKKVFIECPWKDGHSMESGDSETAYFPAGTKGYKQGHFECLHAGCAHRSDEEFLDAFGIRMADFDDVSREVAKAEEKRPPLPKFARNKAGAILAELPNVLAMLRRPDITKVVLGFDSFRDEIMWCDYDQRGAYHAFADDDYTWLREELQNEFGFKPISRDLIRDCVYCVAMERRFDSAINWGKSLRWDGVSRIERFFIDYYAAEDNKYTRSVGVYMWTALGGRLMQPGVKADMVPVLVGRQGIGKSWGIAELVQSPDLRDSIDLMARDADLARRMRGKLVLEVGELRGLHSRDMEAIKDFISRTEESWVPKFKEFSAKYFRRCLMIGTTNKNEFLADRTGNRRWLPVRVGQLDITSLRRDREQLWAEGVARFMAGGVEWQDAQELGEHEHDQYRMTDIAEDLIKEWLHTADETDGTTPFEREYITVKEVLRDALHMDTANVKRADEMKVAEILDELNFTRKKLRVGLHTIRGWIKKL